MNKKTAIINQIDTALFNIKKTNGYNTDLGLLLFKYRDKNNYSEFPIANVTYDLNKRDDFVPITLWGWVLGCNINIYDNINITQTTVDLYTSDVFNAIKTLTLPEVSNWFLNSIHFDYEQGERITAILTISFAFEYTTEKFDF